MRYRRAARSGVLWALACFAAAGFLASAEPPPAKTPEPDISGVVTDPAGHPAAGCKVWLIRSGDDLDDFHVADQTLTDAEGRFVFHAPSLESREIAIFARDAKGRLGWPIRPQRDDPDDAAKPEKAKQIRLVEVHDYHGRLTDASGAPIAKVTIKPLCLDHAGIVEGGFEIGFLPPELAQGIAAETAADGSFVLRGVPATGSVVVTIAAAGFGAPYVEWDLIKPAAIKLSRAASIRGAFVCPASPAAVAGIKLTLRPDSDRPPLDRRSVKTAGFRVWCRPSAVTSKDGTFRFDGVVPGKYEIELKTDDKFAYYTELPPPPEVKSGQAVPDIKLTLRPAIALRGKVVDQKSGEGIKDVEVSLSPTTETDVSRWGAETKTDAKGDFTIYARPGKLQVAVYPPETYLNPSDRRQSRTIDVTKAATLPPFRLERAEPIEGIVVDDSGKPVAGAEVMPYHDFFSPDHPIKTDVAGKFSLKRLSKSERVPIHVRTETAVSDGPVVVDLAKPIRLVVSPKYAFAIRGLVLDEAARPIKDATMHLRAHWWFGHSGTSFGLSSTKSDAQGRFEFRGLWPGDKYGVEFDAKGFEKSETGEVRGEAGKTHDLGKSVLVRADSVVAGRVVDSARQPVADVRVFNTGDAPQTIATTTDAAGRFRLEGLKAGTIYVFAEKAEHRFAAVRTTAGATDVLVTLLRRGEPIPARSAASEPMPLEQHQKLARQMLEKIWTPTDRENRWFPIRAMGSIDAQMALRWDRESGGGYAGYLRPKLAEKIADDDLDEALSMLGRSKWDGTEFLRRLAGRYAVSEPAKATRCLEELVVRARTMDQPDRTEYLAQAGGLAVRLGNKEGGRKLLDEAAAMAEKMGGENANSARRKVATAMAPLDLKRALALLAPIADKDTQDNLRADVAVAISHENLGRALELIGKIDARDGDGARLRIAYRLAVTRPADAIRIVEPIGTSSRDGDGEMNETRAVAFGWIAAAIAPHDKARACSLIDRAFVDLLASDEREYATDRGGRPVMAAFLALRAQQIGYPDMESLVARALACRPTTKNSESPAEVVKAKVAMAALLALADPQAAKDILQSVEPQCEALGPSRFLGDAPDMWLKACVLADAKRRQQWMDAAAASPGGKQNRDRWHALIQAAEILVAPWDDRPFELLHEYSFRSPAKEE